MHLQGTHSPSECKRCVIVFKTKSLLCHCPAFRSAWTLVSLTDARSYEERALYLEAIIQNHREVMTFEDFTAQVFCPSPSYSISGTGEWPRAPPTQLCPRPFKCSSRRCTPVFHR